MQWSPAAAPPAVPLPAPRRPVPGAAEPAAEGGEIVIGCLQDITGATSALGMSVQAGSPAAVDEINAAGGIGGKTVL